MKIIRRTGKNVSVGRIVRAEMAKIVDANLERIKREQKEPIFWSCPLTGSKVYYR